jgi:hypothetical protein
MPEKSFSVPYIGMYFKAHLFSCLCVSQEQAFYVWVFKYMSVIIESTFSLCVLYTKCMHTFWKGCVCPSVCTFNYSMDFKSIWYWGSTVKLFKWILFSFLSHINPNLDETEIIWHNFSQKQLILQKVFIWPYYDV